MRGVNFAMLCHAVPCIGWLGGTLWSLPRLLLEVYRRLPAAPAACLHPLHGCHEDPLNQCMLDYRSLAPPT